MTIENIIQYKSGAKLILLLISKPSLNIDEMSERLRFCINCIHLINNSRHVQDEHKYFDIFKKLRRDLWIKHGENMIVLIRNQEYTVLNKFLYRLFDEEIALISNDSKMVQLIDKIWSKNKVVKFYLEMIFEEFINQ